MSEQLSNVLEALKKHGSKPKQSGKGYMAHCPCPSHGDKRRSLSIGMKNGKVLLNCFGPCDTKEILQSIGLSFQDLYPDTPQKHNKLTVEELAEHLKLSIDHVEKYASAFRDSVKIPYRLDDATTKCKQRKRVSIKTKNKFYWIKSEYDMAAYGLWKLKEARDKEYLIICEGESDVWTLWYYDYPALGIPGATMQKAMEKRHYKGIETFFIIQEDDTAGKMFAENTTTKLVSFGFFNIRIIRMDKGTVKANDPNDLHKLDPDKFKARFDKMLNDAEYGNSIFFNDPDYMQLLCSDNDERDLTVSEWALYDGIFKLEKMLGKKPGEQFEAASILLEKISGLAKGTVKTCFDSLHRKGKIKLVKSNGKKKPKKVSRILHDFNGQYYPQ